MQNLSVCSAPSSPLQPHPPMGTYSTQETAKALCLTSTLPSHLNMDHQVTSSRKSKFLARGPLGTSQQQKSVDQKAKSLPKMYLDKAQKIDRKYCGYNQNQEGPLEQRLKGFGDLICLVAGQYGEVSQHFHDLLAKLSKAKASHIGQMEGRHLSDSERGLLLHQMRRRLSVTIIRAQSSCLLSRLGHFSPGAKEAAKRRALNKRTEEINSQDRRAHFFAHIRGRRIHEQIGTLWI